MSSLLQRARYGRYVEGEDGQGQALEDSQTSAASEPFPAYNYPPKAKDRNATDHRLQFNSKCIYERALPGDAYITCHVDRLQKGYYDSDQIHEKSIDNVRFVALHFVFHASTTVNRFKKATISVSTRKGQAVSGRLSKQRRHSAYSDAGELKRQRINPSIIRHAPHVLYGSISPESLQWNFSLAGSLGVSHGPASATVSPSGGYKGSYKIYEMLRIQGSSRTYRGDWGPEDDVEDGEVVWTLEENTLQRSGLPREFTFIILLQKGDPDIETLFDISIDPCVNSHVGTFPAWFVNLPQYRALPKAPLDLDHEIGQTFEPITDKAKGYNFANLSCSFEDFVALPGTTYTTTDTPNSAGGAQMRTDPTKTPTANSLSNSITLGQAKLPPTSSSHQAQKALYPVPAQARQTPQQNYQASLASHQPIPPPPFPPASQWQYPPYPSLFPDNTLNVRVFVERAASPPSPPDRAKTVSAQRTHSLRRSRSRTGLEKEFGETRAGDDDDDDDNNNNNTDSQHQRRQQQQQQQQQQTGSGAGATKQQPQPVSDMQSAAQRYMAEKKRLSGGRATPTLATIATPLGGRERAWLDRAREKKGVGGGGALSPMRDGLAERVARAPGSRMSYPSARTVSD